MKIKNLLIFCLLFLSFEKVNAQCYNDAANGWGPGTYYGTLTSCSSVTLNTSQASTAYTQWDGVAGVNYTFTLSGGFATGTLCWTHYEYISSVWTAEQSGTGATANFTCQTTSSAGGGWSLVVFYYNNSCPPTWNAGSATLKYQVNSQIPPTITNSGNQTVCQGATVNYTISPSCNYPDVMDAGQASGTVFPVGTTTVTWETYHPNGAGGYFTYAAGSTNQQIALAACNSVYGSGNCTTGSCGDFSYYYATSQGTCACGKTISSDYEFIYNNSGYTTVGQDYGGLSTAVSSSIVAAGTTSPGPFTRANGLGACGVNTWALAMPDLRTQNASTSFTVTVYANQTLSLTGGSATPSICKGTALGTNTVYTFGGGATSASITSGALPAGMSGVVSGSTFVISGTPTASGTFAYTVTTSGAGSCSVQSLSGTITVYAASVLGTPSVSIVNFCESNNTFSPAITVSGNTGTVTFGFRTNTGGAGTLNYGWTTGTSGTCCFPIETSPTDGGANGIFYYVQNGVCPATANSAIIPIQNSYTVTPTLTVTGGTSSTAYSYCSSTAPSTIAIVASFSSVPSTYGSILWYEGTCGTGTLMGTTPLSGTTAVNNYGFNITSAYYPAVGATQNYYAEYAPPSAGAMGCSNLCSGAITVTNVGTPAGGNIATTSFCSAVSGTATVSGETNATAYVWSLPTGLSGSSTTSSISLTGSPGSYTITATASDVASGVTCTGTAVTGTVNVVGTPSGGSIATVNLCSGTSATATVTGAANATQYVWSLPTGLTGSSTSASISVSGTTAGSYTVTATPQDAASGVTCTGTAITGTVNIVNNPSGGSIATVTYCQATGSGTVTIAGVSNATQYIWSLPSSLTGSSTGSSITVSGSTPGSYTVTATPQDVASGITCTGTAVTGTVTVVATPNVSISGTTGICQNSGSATITFTNFSTAPVTVSYTLNSTAQTPINIAASATATVSQSSTTSGMFTYALTSAQYQSGMACAATLSGSAVVTVKAQPSSAALSDLYASNGCGGGHTVTITITGGTSPYNFTVNSTAYTNQSSPYTINPVSNMSYTLSAVTDANGCSAATISNSPYTPAATTLSTGDNYSCTIGANTTQIFFDHSGNLMAQVTSGGTALGSTAVTTTIDGSVQSFGPTHPQHYLQRHFIITPTTNAAANVCLFLADAEANALNTASTGDPHGSPEYYGTFPAASSSAASFQSATSIMKYDGGAQTPGSHTSEQVISGITATHNPTINGNAYNAVWEFCYNVGSFSGFYIYASNSTGDPLPVTLVSFTAQPVNNQYIQLDWITASEIDNSGFEIERSLDGSTYQSIEWVDGHGNSTVTNDYEYADLSAIPGVIYYYRLKQVDVDGNFAYSNIASAELTGDKGFTLEGIYPNPATNQVSIGVISSMSTGATVVMTDMLGRNVMQEDWALSVGYNTNVFDISDIAAGTYLVTVTSGIVKTSKHLVITK
jgi:hypothetical protein